MRQHGTVTPATRGPGGLRLAEESPRSTCDVSPLNSPHTNTRLLEAHCNSPAHCGSSLPGSPRHALLSPDSQGQPTRVRRLMHVPRRYGGLVAMFGVAATAVALWMALATRQRTQQNMVARARVETTVATIRSTAEPFDRTVGARCRTQSWEQHEFWRDSLKSARLEPKAWDPADDTAACEAACARRRWCARTRGMR